jgi:ankyrin repeat protein
VLQHCFPQSIRRTLSQLPKSLDETYERILKEIGLANQNPAHRLLQCLVVAIRPLHVEELAEILALDFEEAEGATPKLNKDWRWQDRQQAVLSACSSLITLVDNGRSRVIQFSHFSVQEFLTSDRLASSKGDASHLHITAEPAHTTLAQACLGTLLQLDGRSSNYRVERSFPLARYASQHWVEHAQFGMVSSRIQDGMRRLFDSAQPHFAAWLRLYDFDQNCFGYYRAGDHGSSLYYASLCGFRDLAAHIIDEHPEQVNDKRGANYSPLAAALRKRHFRVAKLLHQHGAAVDIRGYKNGTLLYAASSSEGDVDVVRWLLSHGSDAESRNDDDMTPIIGAAANGRVEIVQTLLGHGVQINATCKHGGTPLHLASFHGYAKIVILLLQLGANIGARNMEYRTPLHLASSRGRAEAARLLLDHVADMEAKDMYGMTPLHLSSSEWNADETVRLLLDHGANANAQNEERRTPLHSASHEGKVETMRLLLDRGASANAQDKDGITPLHLASYKAKAEAVRALLDHGANAKAQDMYGQTPLHQASILGNVEAARLLLDRGANANALDKFGGTPFHQLGISGTATEFVRLLLDRGARVDAKDDEGRTPVQLIEVGSPAAQMLTEVARYASG